MQMPYPCHMCLYLSAIHPEMCVYASRCTPSRGMCVCIIMLYIMLKKTTTFLLILTVVIATNLLLAEALPEKRMRMNTESEIQVPGPRLFACW